MVGPLRSSSYFQIHWQQYFEAMFAGVDVTLSSQERVIVKEVQYLSDLVVLLDTTPLRVIGMFTQVMLFTSAVLSRRIQQHVFLYVDG
jgi:hypothetical protein